MTTTELASPRVSTVIGVDAPIVAQNTAAPLAVVAAAPEAAIGAPANLGTLSGASPGTQIIRGDARIPVDGQANLMPGDRVIVPQNGSANVTFPGPTPNKAPLTGVLAGGTDATIGVKQVVPGVEQVVVDVAAGDMFMASPDELADAASVAVRKKAAAAAGSILDNFGLAALGIGGLAALASSRGGSDSGAATMMPPPGSGGGTGNPGGETGGGNTGGGNTGGGNTGGGNTGGGTTPTPTAGSGLLSPTATVVDHATDLLGGGILAGSGLPGLTKPVDGVVSELTGALNGALSPLVGDNFSANTPNNFDPIDHAVTNITGAVTPVVAPLVDGLLGNGATASLVNPLVTQVDYLTDALSGLVNRAGLGELANGLYAVEQVLTPVTNLLGDITSGLVGTVGDVLAPVNALLGGITGGTNGLLGGVLSPVTGLLGGVTGGQTLDAGGLVGDLLAPVTGLLGELTGSLGNIAGSGSLTSPLGELNLGLGSNAGSTLGGLLGDATGIVGDLLGNVPVLSTPGAGSILDTATSLLGGAPSMATGLLGGLQPSSLPGGDLLGGLLEALGQSASTGALALNTNDLPVSADSLLQALSGADPTGGLLGPVTGTFGGLLDQASANSPDAGVSLQAGGLLGSLGGLQDTGGALLGQIPGISSATDALSAAAGATPLGSLLNNVTHI